MALSAGVDQAGSGPFGPCTVMEVSDPATEGRLVQLLELVMDAGTDWVSESSRRRLLRHGRLRLHAAKRAQGTRGQSGSRQCDALLPARRQDRCGRAERDGEVHPGQDHGRARAAIQRRRDPRPRRHGRHLAAGAAAHRGQDSARQRRGGSRRDQGEAGSLQRDHCRAGRPGCRLRRVAAGDGGPANRPRPRRRMGPRLPSRTGYGCLAVSAAGRARRPAQRW